MKKHFIFAGLFLVFCFLLLVGLIGYWFYEGSKSDIQYLNRELASIDAEIKELKATSLKLSDNKAAKIEFMKLRMQKAILPLSYSIPLEIVENGIFKFAGHFINFPENRRAALRKMFVGRARAIPIKGLPASFQGLFKAYACNEGCTLENLEILRKFVEEYKGD
ncbi:MAG: hypothetical protein KKB51_03840 [Candidatus Riflebacteria bacterium]|nr:hypothetical protein [Candidatus Riflebacteria bacterium]